MCKHTVWAMAIVAMAAQPSQADWKPADGPLMTRWAADVSPETVHAEYPRPQMVRPNWQNLNGLWEYAIQPREQGRPSSFQGEILVPFPVESALSGVMKRVGEANRLWYRRTFTIPDRRSGQRTLLHFGAVDWQATVWVNGRQVGKHKGGYDPFTFDVTDALTPGGEQELVVSVWDPTDQGTQPRGKQVEKPHGIWYTPVTGIWQTVWLESVPKTHIQSLTITPDIDRSELRLSVDVAGQKAGGRIQATALDGDNQVATAQGEAGGELVLKIADAKLWSPDSPFLYDLRVELSDGSQQVRDVVTSYFGMRKIALGQDKSGVTRLFLNNEPLFQYGTLDQGWWPDGLYTAPTDEALKYDLEITQKLGFNMVRKHVKVEPARWYYHCDRLGLLVWQDMPNGDKHAPWNNRGRFDGQEITRSPESTEQYNQELKAMIDAFRNYPCIVMWVPFNEAWGQFDTVRVTKWIQEYDPTRLVNCASGGNDFPVGDVHDIHRYPGPAAPPTTADRAAILGEFGGLGLPLEGHTWQDKENWGYRNYKNREELLAAYLDLQKKLRPLIGQGLAGAIYTQTTDVEIEVNGLMSYDRALVKMDADTLAKVHQQLYQPPPMFQTLIPTSQREGQTWQYTLEKPGENWHEPDFDDSSWKTGRGGFGTPETPGSVVGTEWNTSDIWLRRTFQWPPEAANNSQKGIPHLIIHHDEKAEIYINGRQVAQVTGYTTDYVVVPLDEALSGKTGENTLAVHCHQTGGGQYIDVGLVNLIPSE